MTKPTVQVSPTTPRVGDVLIFTGSGYTPNVGVTVEVLSPYAASFFGAKATDGGTFSTATTEAYTAEQPGTYKVETWQGGHHPAGTLTFSVLPA